MEKNIYTYLNYRDYLKDEFQQRREGKKYFSFSHFARLADMGSHSYVRMVMKGERNLSSKTIYKFSKALKLPKKEAAYFEALVQFTQTTDESEKDLFFKRLKGLRPKSFVQELNQDSHEYFTKRYFVTIREMVALKNFKEDYEWVASRLQPSIKPAEAEHAVQTLLRLSLLKRDESGKLLHTYTTLATMPELDSVEIYNYNHQILTEAKGAILSRPRDLVEMISVTIPIPVKLLPELKDLMINCKDDMLRLINDHKDEYDEVFQVNFQYYPLTRAKDDDVKS